MSTIAVAQFVPATEAEGPGRRFALWVQGCPLRCPGCCNPEMLPFSGGTPVPVTDLLHRLNDAVNVHRVEGISLLGGEPLAHAPGLVEFARGARDLKLSVMVYSGYTLAEARSCPDPAVHHLLALTDVLVDGRYDRDRPEPSRRWVGSANQQVHFLTDRYSPAEPCWYRPNTLEIRWRGGELSVNGFPAKSAVGLWQRPANRAVEP